MRGVHYLSAARRRQRKAENVLPQQQHDFNPELMDVQTTIPRQQKPPYPFTPDTTSSSTASTSTSRSSLTDHNHRQSPSPPQQQRSMLEMEDISENDYFLPFDDDLEEEFPPSQPAESSSTTSMDTRPASVPEQEEVTLQTKYEDKRNPVENALAQLQAFFLGGPVAHNSSSHVETTQQPQRLQQVTSNPPVENGPQQQQERCLRRSLFPHSHSMPIPQNSESGREDKSSNDYSNQPSETTLYPPNKFRMLQRQDRADSMPLVGLTRKSSMKKISSIGKLDHSQSSTMSLGSLKREISFGNLEIRRYEVALSDHPGCSYGPPVQLSWEYQKEQLVVPVDSYEMSRSPRRDREDLVLSYNDRRHMLIKQAGYSKKEVKQAMKEVDRVKRERLVTDMLLPASILDEAVETSVDYVKQFFLPLQPRKQRHSEPTPKQQLVNGQQQHQLLHRSYSESALKPSPCSVTAYPELVRERKRENYPSATI